jgi:hypothetical protein
MKIYMRLCAYRHDLTKTANNNTAAQLLVEHIHSVGRSAWHFPAPAKPIRSKNRLPFIRIQKSKPGSQQTQEETKWNT